MNLANGTLYITHRGGECQVIDQSDCEHFNGTFRECVDWITAYRSKANDAERAQHILCPVTRYRELAVSQMFRFPGDDVIYRKTSNGYQDSRQSHTWKTGQQTAVIPV